MEVDVLSMIVSGRGEVGPRCGPQPVIQQAL